jgi:hypothetical protein
MTRRKTAARAAAQRRAQEAKAARDAENSRREDQIEAALADYYLATSQAEQIRTAARQKADRELAEAERATAAPTMTARNAVRRLRRLLGGNAEVAALCGLSSAAVREMLSSADGGAEPEARPSDLPAPSPHSAPIPGQTRAASGDRDVEG